MLLKHSADWQSVVSQVGNLRSADGLMSFQVEPFISTWLQPGVTNRNRNRAASAALSYWAKPLKRLSPPGTPATGLKPYHRAEGRC